MNPQTSALPVNYTSVGQGMPILVLPGFGMTNWLFQNMAERLADQAQFVLIDNRGTGKNPPSELDYQLDDLAQDALLLADFLNLESFGVLGISMGGIVAQRLYELQPHRVDRMVLMCTLGPGPNYLPPPTFDEATLHDLYSGDIEMVVRSMVTATVHPTLQTRNPACIDHIVHQRLAHRVSATELIRQQRAVLPFFQQTRDEVPITCPLLIMSGKEDRVVPLSNAERLAATHAGAQLATFPQTDHLFFLEQPDKVAMRLSHFLEQT